MFTREQLLAWQKGGCAELMRDCGIKPGQVVIDYGCGKGNYAFGAAEAIGPEGRVYALDIKPEILDWLDQEKSLRGTDNLIPKMSHENADMDFEDESVDAVWFYDMIHMEGIRKHFLEESRRILKPGGLLSILPFHLAEDETVSVMKEVENAGFVPDRILKDHGLHFDLHLVTSEKEESFSDLEHATVYNFRRL